MRRSAALAGIVLLGVAAGRGWAHEPKASSARIAELEGRVLELQRDKTVAEVELARLRQEIERLRSQLAELEATASTELETSPRRATASPVRDEPAPLPPTLPPTVPPGIESEDIDDDEIETAPVRAPAADPTADSAATALTEPSLPSSARELYDRSYTLFNQRRYQESEEGFRRFLADHAGSDLADNAQFWIGECRYARGDYEAALTAFMRTVESWPNGNKVPDALLKAGKSLEALGDPERAAVTYRELIRRFGDRAAAAAARERLDALR